jgi:site-specific recombinase XerD
MEVRLVHVKKYGNGAGKWEVFVYVDDFVTGKKKLKHKRGFATKREAVAWAEQFKLQQGSNLDMTFQSFWELYRDDMVNRLRENTVRTKDYITELKILPYFGQRKLLDIKAADIRKWQNKLIKEGYSQTYLRTINNQLSAIFNYAVKYYDFPKNPCKQAGAMGKDQADEMQYWTKEEFETFVECVKDKPVSYMAFLTLYWTGIRVGDTCDKISLNQQKPSKYAGLRRFSPENFLQRSNKFMKERPIFYKTKLKCKVFQTYAEIFLSYYKRGEIRTIYFYQGLN